ncbi:hypothetical protein SAMN05216339_12214 [Nitrosomonas eutropha]|uniref:Uncharacterized protein n=1 Tax=Nitrosomonas eutropha TaxID=916 RepID=A0A1I7JE71_9PROT|nr:major capsid protein [Nitrosomonas eutropha]SFU83448.1 hypothetical protein SAMN05216339_12214 [Nitrosomonas eutropha]
MELLKSRALYMITVLIGLFSLPMFAHADMSADVTAAIAQFAAVNTAIPVVGGAFLLALGLLAAWKLIRGAFA